jgi:hypothetical protein
LRLKSTQTLLRVIFDLESELAAHLKHDIVFTQHLARTAPPTESGRGEAPTTAIDRGENILSS